MTGDEGRRQQGLENRFRFPPGNAASRTYRAAVSGRRAKERRQKRDGKEPASSGPPVVDFEAARQRRVRYGPLPKPPEEVKVPYAKRHDEADTDEGEVIAWLMTQPEWEETIGAECDAVEAERPTKGPAGSYDTRELEAALFFQFMCGIRTYRAARNRLASDRGRRARVALGYNQDRPTRCPRELKLKAGIPSEATISRHRKRFPVERRLDAYRAYFDRLRKLNAADPGLREGLRFLNIDGSAQLTSLTCPKLDRDGSGRIVNASQVTCPEGGYIGKEAPPVKQGMGFGVVPLTCVNALPWAYDHGTINIKEGDAAVHALADYAENVLPHAGDRQLGVLSADSGFQKTELRALARGMGIIENIHEVSHAAGRETTDVERERADRRQLDIKGYPNWYANGHRELKCRCGKAHVFRRVELQGERAVARVEGRCDTCGSVTITSGKWKTVRDTKRRNSHPHGQLKLVRVEPGDPESVIDWQFGNPLTYYDPIANKYGSMRFGHGEGFNGACVKRFKLLKTKGYYRTKAQAELHALMVFCSMHGLTQHRREAVVDAERNEVAA